MTPRYQRKPNPPRGKSAKSKDWQYEQFKMAWKFHHPEATQAEYEKAMREIARKIGI